MQPVNGHIIKKLIFNGLFGVFTLISHLISSILYSQEGSALCVMERRNVLQKGCKGKIIGVYMPNVMNFVCVSLHR